MVGILTDPMLSAVPAVVSELRADSDVAALVGTDLANIVRVRIGEPRGAIRQPSGDYPGDARGAGEYQQFIVVISLDEQPHPSLPIFRFTHAIRSYGATYQGASAVWGACVKALHGVKAREKANGLGIYISKIETGGTHDSDPRTQQPFVLGTVSGWATAGSIAEVGS